MDDGGEKMKNCSICDTTKDTDPNTWRGSSSAAMMIKHSCCFQCSFWLAHVELVDDPASVRIDGVHRRLGPEPDKHTPSHCLGHGGAEFRIRFFDGREVVSHNVWHQGHIPERFRHLLPDNAEFIRE